MVKITRKILYTSWEDGWYTDPEKGKGNTMEAKNLRKMRMIKEDEKYVFFLCEECIASKAMNEGPQITTFRDSSLYAWLNGRFAEEYLSEEERSRLEEVTLLSSEEAAEAFDREEALGCRPEKKAVEEGVRIGGNGNCWWWLRDTGFAGDFYRIVDFAGHICTQGTYQTLQTNGVRPVVILKK